MTLSGRRRWFRFSLRTFFALLTAFGIWLGWELRIVRERRDGIEWIESHSVASGYTFPNVYEYRNPPSGQPLLARLSDSRLLWYRLLGKQVTVDEVVVSMRFADQAERLQRIFPEAEIRVESQAEFDERNTDFLSTSSDGGGQSDSMKAVRLESSDSE